MSATLKILSLVAMSVVAIVVIAILVVMWTLQTWAAPLLPTLYFASALFGLFIIMGSAWFVVTRRELAEGMGAEGASAEERGLQRLVAITATVVLGVFALAVIGSWNVDAVRAKFVESRATHVQLEQVLTDPSSIVRLQACEEIFQRGWVFRSGQELVAALDPQPAMAVKCLQTAKEREWKGVEAIANKVNDGWTAAMMRTGPEGVERACELAPWSPMMSELGEQSAEPRLLHCATSAASPGVRQCCASTVASRGKLLDLLGEPASYSEDATQKTFPQLVKLSFQPLSLSAEDQQVAATLGTDDEAVRQWMVELGCGRIDPTEAQPAILGGLFPLIEADSCNLTPAEESVYSSPLEWARLCEFVRADTSKRPVQQVVCQGVQEARILKAVENARLVMHEAVRATFLERDAEFVRSGVQAAEALAADDVNEKMAYVDFLNRRAVDELGVKGQSSGGCRQVSVSASGSRPNVQVTSTMNCKRVRDDMTVGEYLGKYKKEQKELREDLANPWDSRLAKEKSKGNQANVDKARREYQAAIKEARENQ